MAEIRTPWPDRQGYKLTTEQVNDLLRASFGALNRVLLVNRTGAPKRQRHR